VDIIEHINSLPVAERAAAEAGIEVIELAALDDLTFMPGMVATVRQLKSKGVRVGVATRNCEAAMLHFVSAAGLEGVFDPLICRRSFNGSAFDRNKPVRKDPCC